MWVFTTGGFVSAVEHRDDTSMVMVRARDKQSLETMIEGITLIGAAAGEEPQDLKIIQKTPSDYPWRVEMSKASFAQFLVHETMNYLNYHNFKTALTSTRGKKWHDAAMGVWVDMLAVSDVKDGTNYNGGWNGGHFYGGMAAWEEQAVDDGLSSSYSELYSEIGPDFTEGSEDRRIAEEDVTAYHEMMDREIEDEQYARGIHGFNDDSVVESMIEVDEVGSVSSEAEGK